MAAQGCSRGRPLLALSLRPAAPSVRISRRPPAPDVDRYAPGQARLAARRSGPRVAGQHFVNGADVSARWWAAFHSAPLNDLIRQSVEHNPSLQAAEAAIKVAQYNALAQRGLFFPQVTGNSTSSQQSDRQSRQVPPIPTGGRSPVFTLVTDQLTVSYVPDIWGANARGREPGRGDRAAIVPARGRLSRADHQCGDRRDPGSFAARPDRRHPAHHHHRAGHAGHPEKPVQLRPGGAADVLAQEAALAQAEQFCRRWRSNSRQQRDLLTALAGQFSADEILQKFDLRISRCRRICRSACRARWSISGRT